MNADAQFSRAVKKSSLRKNVSVFRVFLVRMRENAEQKNSEYGHFLCSAYLLKLLNRYLNPIQNDKRNIRELILIL